jgi:hypothetical protein
MDMITTGRTATDRNMVQLVVDELKMLFATKQGQKLSIGQIRQQVTMKNFNTRKKLDNP